MAQTPVDVILGAYDSVYDEFFDDILPERPGKSHSVGSLTDRPVTCLREVIEALRRHPIVVNVRGHPPSTFTEVRATLAPSRWEYGTESATFRVTWQPIEPPEFAFHYSEEEFDCGWHYEPNPHVDGYAHYQKRDGDGAYRYELISFDGDTAPELVWEVMERLKQRLVNQE